MIRDIEYHIVLNLNQVLGISNDVIAFGQNIKIADVEHKLMLISEKYYKKLIKPKETVMDEYVKRFLAAYNIQQYAAAEDYIRAMLKHLTETRDDY
jgi:ribosomal protein RSM22 (predicted rRNA methylase)